MRNLKFHFKIGDEISVVNLDTWASAQRLLCPIGVVNRGDAIVVHSIGKLGHNGSCDGDFIPFTGVFNGKEYGFSFGGKNKFKLVSDKITKSKKVNRNSSEQIQRDMYFLSSIKEHMGTNNLGYVSTMVDDWYLELKKMQHETT